jgi:hypothetical protein
MLGCLRALGVISVAVERQKPCPFGDAFEAPVKAGMALQVMSPSLLSAVAAPISLLENFRFVLVLRKSFKLMWFEPNFDVPANETDGSWYAFGYLDFPLGKLGPFPG